MNKLKRKRNFLTMILGVYIMSLNSNYILRVKTTIIYEAMNTFVNYMDYAQKRL